jgi:uncharacterized membrane protein YqjE
VRDAVGRVLDAVQLLVREHIELARVEIKRDVRAMGRDLALAALGLPVLLTGWILAMAALALALPLPRWASFGTVALINLAGGAALTATGARRARGEQQILRDSREELFRDKAAVGSLAAAAAPFLADGAPGGAANRSP